MKRNLTLGSLFSGSGGFELAGTLAGITPVWNSEIEPFPIRVTHKRFPNTRHYGNVKNISGKTLEPVDIITFGSPCQNLSMAGNRQGLEGKESGLFREAIRIIREMREKTDGSYPRFAVWENVCGALSCSEGRDFQAVLQAFLDAAGIEVHVPMPEKWEKSGAIILDEGDSFSLAWRTLDAQFWGVAQRRRRIFLVADFAGQGALQILSEPESLSWNPETSRGTREGTSWIAAGGPDKTGTICLNDQGGKNMSVTDDHTATLRAEAHHPPVVLTQVFENHGKDARYNGPLKQCSTLTKYMGTGGNNVLLVATYDVRLSSLGTNKASARGTIKEAQTSRTIDCAGNNPNGQQGGIAIVYCASKSDYFTRASKNIAGALPATDYKVPPIINEGIGYVRRLTPLECCRLQGFPDTWCDGIVDCNPSEEEMEFWRVVFRDYASAMGGKVKSDRQIQTWLSKPPADSAIYRMWGNGVALPCVYFVLSGIADYIRRSCKK